jgi:hypothetical protein
MPRACFMMGTQSGSVITVTRIEPASNRSMSSALLMRQAFPAAMASPMARPVSSLAFL